MSDKDIKDLSPDQYDQKIQEMQIQKAIQLEQALKSSDPASIIKAQAYLAEQSKKMQQGVTRAFLFDPYDAQFSGQNYKRPIKKVGFDVLKRMGGLHMSKMVKTTRIDQVKNFLNFTTDTQKEGFTIRRKKGLFDNDRPLNREDRKVISLIVSFLENSKAPIGDNKTKSAINFDPSKWDIFDDLDEFVSQILDDSLTYDQLTFELQRNRRFEIGRAHV